MGTDQLNRGAEPEKVVLTKAAPRVSLTKQDQPSGFLRVNLNWNTGALGSRGLFKWRHGGIDLDLGCLYEFTDQTKGVVQALGNAFQASPDGVREPVIRLDGDDRVGANSAGENLFIDMAMAHLIKRILIFALIYEGVANWAAVDGVVTLFPVTGPQVEVRLDDPHHGARICGVALLQGGAEGLSIEHEVNYLFGAQSDLDRAYRWGLNWTPGRK